MPLRACRTPGPQTSGCLLVTYEPVPLGRGPLRRMAYGVLPAGGDDRGGNPHRLTIVVVIRTHGLRPGDEDGRLGVFGARTEAYCRRALSTFCVVVLRNRCGFLLVLTAYFRAAKFRGEYEI